MMSRIPLRFRRLFIDAPIKAKILVLVMTVLAFPFMLSLGLIRENYRAISSFSDDVALFGAIARLGEANARNPELVGAYLESGSFEDLRAYNESVDELSAALDAIEDAASDLETRFILSSIRNSFQSFYEEAHLSIRARRFASPDPYAGYYRAERIARYLDDYASMLTDRNLAASASAYGRRVQGAAAGRALALTALAAGALICVAFGIVFSDYLTGPLRRLAAAASRMAAGDLAVDPVPISSSDEVGRLSDSFNTMSAHIADLVEGLKEKAAVEKRLHREELRSAQREAPQGIRIPGPAGADQSPLPLQYAQLDLARRDAPGRARSDGPDRRALRPAPLFPRSGRRGIHARRRARDRPEVRFHPGP